VQDARDPLQTLGGDRIGDIPERQVGGYQRHTQAARGEHHHHLFGVGQLGEKFGVSREGNAGFVDHALVHRGGNHAGETAVQAAAPGAGQRLQYIVSVARVELACRHRCGERCVPDVQTVGWRGLAGPVLRSGIAQFDAQPQLFGALGQQRAAGDGHQWPRLRLACQQQAQIRADAGRFAGGQNEGAGRGHRDSPLGIGR